MKIGPQLSSARSSDIEDIAPLSPVGPIHRGPDTRGSFLSTGKLSGSMQCIGRISTPLSICNPESIEAATSSLHGAKTLQPILSSNSLAEDTLFMTLNDTLR